MDAPLHDLIDDLVHRVVGTLDSTWLGQSGLRRLLEVGVASMTVAFVAEVISTQEGMAQQALR